MMNIGYSDLDTTPLLPRLCNDVSYIVGTLKKECEFFKSSTDSDPHNYSVVLIPAGTLIIFSTVEYEFSGDGLVFTYLISNCHFGALINPDVISCSIPRASVPFQPVTPGSVL